MRDNATRHKWAGQPMREIGRGYAIVRCAQCGRGRLYRRDTHGRYFGRFFPCDSRRAWEKVRNVRLIPRMLHVTWVLAGKAGYRPRFPGCRPA